MGQAAKKAKEPEERRDAPRETEGAPEAHEGPRLVRGRDARRAAERLRPEESEREPEVIPDEQWGLEERRVDTRLEGLSGMGAALGEVSEDKDQLGHVERQGLRREEAEQIERSMEVEPELQLPEIEGERALEPRENKGMR